MDEGIASLFPAASGSYWTLSSRNTLCEYQRRVLGFPLSSTTRAKIDVENFLVLWWCGFAKTVLYQLYQNTERSLRKRLAACLCQLRNFLLFVMNTSALISGRVWQAHDGTTIPTDDTLTDNPRSAASPRPVARYVAKSPILA